MNTYKLLTTIFEELGVRFSHGRCDKRHLDGPKEVLDSVRNSIEIGDGSLLFDGEGIFVGQQSNGDGQDMDRFYPRRKQ